MTRPIPPRDVLTQLARHCLLHAGDLLADARQLAEADRCPTAHALATLALEEIGKAHLCVLVLLPPMAILSSDEFWKSWRDHAEKLKWAAGLLRIIINEPTGPLADLYGQLTDEARAAHLLKMRGLYVDYADDGTVLLPADITAAEAAAMIKDVQASLDFLMPTWGDEGIFDRLRELAEHENELADLHAGIMRRVETDPEATLADFRKWMETERDRYGETTET